MRVTLLSQKEERDRLLAKPYLTRHVTYDIEALLSGKQIKLLTGPRRAGKSTQALLMLRGKNFAYLNFDDNLLLKQWNENSVMHLLNEVYPNYEYLLLDEVQNLDGWDLWVSKLYRNGINLIITGSNAKMLSSEMATVLTGRYLEVKVLPFSLAEYLDWNKVSLTAPIEVDGFKISALLDDYLHRGGYPETLDARHITHNYLSTLFDSIVWKDVVERHKVRNVSDLNNVALYLLTNFCNPLSASGLVAALGLSSVNTARKFMDYLAEPYLFFYLPRFDNKFKLMRKAPQKVYVVDNGFVAARAFNLSDNLGRLLENQVFIELMRRGYNVAYNNIFYYRSRNDKEVDFVLRNGSKLVRLIQVCYDMSVEKTRKREIASIVECAEELKCNDLMIITACEEDEILVGNHTVRVIPIHKYSSFGFSET